MKKTIHLFCSLILFLPIIVTGQEAQDSTWMKVEMRSGNVYVGQILKKEEVKLQLKTKLNDTLTIKRAFIKMIKPLGERPVRKNIYDPHNPFATKYFMSPSAYGLKPAEIKYQNGTFIYNSLNIGITNNIEVGGGVFFETNSSLFGQVNPTVFWVSTKVTAPVIENYFNVGIGSVHVNLVDDDRERNGGGWLYGVATLGGRNKNLTLGLGWSYGFDENPSGVPSIMLSYTNRTSKKIAFVTENYLINGNESSIVVLSGGVRIIGKRVKWDLGVYALGNIRKNGSVSVFPLPFPWISFSFAFDGKRKRAISSNF